MCLPSVVTTQCGTATGMAPAGNPGRVSAAFAPDGVGVPVGAGRLDCFVVGNDRQLWRKSFSGGWSRWEPLGGNIYSNPAAVSWGSNRIDVFAFGGDHAMWHRWYE